MKTKLNTVNVGQTLVYNDGRAGHSNVECVVLSVGKLSFAVQFADRADTTTIKFSDAGWVDYLTAK